MPPKRACRLALLLAAAAAYLLFLLFLELPTVSVSPVATHRPRRRELEAASLRSSSPLRPNTSTFPSPVPPRRSRLALSSIRVRLGSNSSSASSIESSASAAFAAAGPVLTHLLSSPLASSPSPSPPVSESCPATVSVPRDRLANNTHPGTQVAVELPCGMAVGSRVTVVAQPRRRRAGSAASQFMVELLGTKAVQGEEPPRILHFNPRIAGDFSGRPVIELNTCYRMQWAQPQRCEGWASRPDEEKVDGELKCERWARWDDGAKSEESKVRVVPAKYIMKCDDDTFVRIDSVLDQVKKVPTGGSMYVGNINYYHRPLRSGKWAVTYEEWEEEAYPPYANGPGYVISSDIAQYIVSEFDNSTLRLFKMEDVSMGMWVEKFHRTRRPVEYLHDFRFYQSGCFDGYYTAHYQSPQHMICLWRKLQSGSAQCCNSR